MLNPTEKQTHERVSAGSMPFLHRPAGKPGGPLTDRRAGFPLSPLGRLPFLRHHPGEPFPRQAGDPPSFLATGPRLFCFHLREPSLFPNSLRIQVYVRRIFSPAKGKNLGGNALTAKVTTKFTAKATIPTFKSLTA